MQRLLGVPSTMFYELMDKVGGIKKRAIIDFDPELEVFLFLNKQLI